PLSRRKFIRTGAVASGLVGAGIAGAVIAKRRSQAPKTAHSRPTNPFAYNVEHLRKTDPRLIHYQQAGQIRSPHKYGVELGNHVSLEGLQRGFDAILLATGELSKDEARKLGFAVTATGLKVDTISGQVSFSQGQEAQAG